MQLPIESLNLLMLNVGLARHNADWNWKDVSSPFTRIYYVVEGTARLHLLNEVVELKPNNLYIIPAHTVHSYECDGKFVHYYLHLYEGFKKETDVFDFYEIPTEVQAQEGDVGIFERMCMLHPDAELPASDPRSYDNSHKFADYVSRYNDMHLYEKMQLRGSVLILFSRFMQYARPRVWTQDARIAKVVKYVHSNIYNEISSEELADVACVTKPYLIRLFNKHFGISPLRYINQKKIERAQLLLLTENLSVKDIAYTIGFNDDSYFIRLFKKLTGTTPQEYRMQMK